MYLGNFLVLMSLLMTGLSQYPAQVGYRGFQKQVIPIVSQDFQISPDNKAYRFSYASADGSRRHESGTQKGAQGYSVTGSFSYTLPNGAPIQVHYVSDEFGYQPSGSGVHPDIITAVAKQVAEARTSPRSSYGSIPYSVHRPIYG